MMPVASTTQSLPHGGATSDGHASVSMSMRRLEAALRFERPRLLRYLYHLAGRDVAPDLVQEVFVRAAATPRLAEIDCLPSYLTRIGAWHF